jgi:oligopeptide transport system substrate-binding protein
MCWTHPQRIFLRTPFRVLAAVCVLSVLAGSVAASAQSGAPAKVLQLPMRTDGPRSIDPGRGSTTYDAMASSQFYETLLTNSYADPGRLEPLLLAEMPTTQDNGKTWRFRLKEGVRFHDNECFPGGRGRTVTTDDVFYSIKRLADRAATGEQNWWLLENTILGLDEAYAAQRDAGIFDYAAPIEGLRKINDLEFEIVLRQPVYRFLYILSMFQTSVVPREAVERYGKDFGFRPVGTGPFVLDTFVPKQSLTGNRNPNYHHVRYPAAGEWSAADRRARLHRSAGQRVPFVDRIEFTMYVQDQPMWLEFNQGNLGYTQVPEEYFLEAFDRASRSLKETYTARGVRTHDDQLLDFIFRGFNMEDPLLGGYTPEKRALRQAIALAIDLEEINQTFYNGLPTIYDGPIPPGLDGHPENGRAPVSYRGPNLELARQKLAEAGYPNGEGLPPIQFYTSVSSLNTQVAEMTKRQLERVNIRFEPTFLDFAPLIQLVNRKQAPMFGFAWGSDYPDAENNLALFYSPNESPGSNHYNYKNTEYDRLYEQILTMQPGAERTVIYERMRDMVIEDVPFIGSQGRRRYYLINPWLLNAKPTERFHSWYKFLDVDDSRR